MPSTEKRVNLTLDRGMLDALDAYMAGRGYRYRAQAVYHILWDVLIKPACSPPEGVE